MTASAAVCLVRVKTSAFLMEEPSRRCLRKLIFFGFLHVVDPMFHGLGGGRHRGYGHPDRVAKDGVGEPLDLLRHRRREEEGLPFRWQLVDDPPDVVDEAHVEHPVGLVEDKRFDGPGCTSPCDIRSRSRPGVATRMSIPRRSACDCGPG